MPGTDIATTSGWWSIAPPLLAIVLAMRTRQVIPSLVAGIWLGWIIVAGGNPLAGTSQALDCLVDVFAEGWRTRVILFTLWIGSLLVLLQQTGGVAGFLQWAGRWAWARSKRGAQLLAWSVGLGVFIESNITCLVVGTLARPLFDRLRLSREKLAYICDTTSAPVCILLPINGWGAMVLGLLSTQQSSLGANAPLEIFLQSIPWNFYALLSVAMVLLLSVLPLDFGPMRRAQLRAAGGETFAPGARPVLSEAVLTAPPPEHIRPRAANLFVPLATLILMVPVGILVTGVGTLREAQPDYPAWPPADQLMEVVRNASGATAVFWAVAAAWSVVALLSLGQKLLGVGKLVEISLEGASGLLPLALIMTLAFATGMTCEALGTGPFVAGQIAPHLDGKLIAPLVFLVSGFIAFATGTSWGTFAIMIPLAIPLAASNPDVSPEVVLAAVLGGGVFGDHCSPISDTTVVSSLAACCDHMDHVRTQLPYALVVAAATTTLYYFLG